MVQIDDDAARLLTLLDPLDFPVTGAPSCLAADPLSDAFRHSGWADRRRLIYDALVRTRQTAARLYAFRTCGDHAYVVRSLGRDGDRDVYHVVGSG